MSKDLKRDAKRAEAKMRIYLNKRLQLKQAFERIDYRYDVVWPAIDEIREQVERGEEIPQLEVSDA